MNFEWIAPPASVSRERSCRTSSLTIYENWIFQSVAATGLTSDKYSQISLMSRKTVIWSSDLSRGECSLSRSCSDFWTSSGTFSGSLYRHSSTKRSLLLFLTTHNMGVSSKCGRDLNFNSRNVALTENLYIKEQDPPLYYCVSRVWLQSFDYSGVASTLCMMPWNLPILHSRPHRICKTFL